MLPSEVEYIAEFKDLIASHNEPRDRCGLVPGAEAKKIAERRQAIVKDLEAKLDHQQIPDGSSVSSSCDADARSSKSDNESTATSEAPDVLLDQQTRHTARLVAKRDRICHETQWWSLRFMANFLPGSKVDWLRKVINMSDESMTVWQREQLELTAHCECSEECRVLVTRCSGCSKRICRSCMVWYSPNTSASLSRDDRMLEQKKAKMLTERNFVGVCANKECICKRMCGGRPDTLPCKCAEKIDRAFTLSETVRLGPFCRDCKYNKDMSLPENKAYAKASDGVTHEVRKDERLEFTLC